MYKVTITPISRNNPSEPIKVLTHNSRAHDVGVAITRAVQKHFGRSRKFFRNDGRQHDALQGHVHGQICYPYRSGSQLLWNPIGMFSVVAELI